MKTFATSTALAAVLALGFATTAIADEESESRDVPTFNKIEIDGALEITVHVGKEQSVIITTEDDYLDRVETTVDNGVLTIDMKGRWWRNADVVVNITVANLDSFVIDGAAEVELNDVNSESFVLEIDGAGDVEITGTCGDAAFEINGAGDVDAEDFQCKTVEIVINGAGDAEVYASEMIVASINGVGDITVHGDPDKVRPQINGFGSFNVD